MNMFILIDNEPLPELQTRSDDGGNPLNRELLALEVAGGDANPHKFHDQAHRSCPGNEILTASEYITFGFLALVCTRSRSGRHQRLSDIYLPSFGEAMRSFRLTKYSVLGA